MSLRAVLLDVDGTLVLSNDIQAKAWVEAFNDYGYGVSFEQVRPLIGMGGDHLVNEVVPAFDSEEGSGKAIANRRKELIINHYASNLTAAAGARELVQRMQNSGLKLVAATSATPEELQVLLKVAQVEDLLPETVTTEDAAISKPDLDLVEAALGRVNMQPNEVVMLGDTPYDIQAGRQAGVDVIAFRSGGFSDENLAGAVAIYNDPADLLAHYEESPLAQSESSNLQSMPSSSQSSKSLDAVPFSADLSPIKQSVHKGESILNEATHFTTQLWQTISQWVRQNPQFFVGTAVFLGLILATRIFFAVLNTLNNLPLLPGLFELVGASYVIWFTNRYLLKAETRAELSRALENWKAQTLGR